MEQIKKIKVAMICHFSNTEVRGKLPLNKQRLYAFVRKLLRMPRKGKGYGDIAPWDTGIINEFRNRNDVDLYVISAHSGLRRRVVAFESKNVHYWFVRCEVANALRRLMKSTERWLKLNPMIPDVRRIVNSINPDLVMLVGAENPYIASTILGVKNFPTYVLCQTIYNNPERSLFGEVDVKCKETEYRIFSELNNFAVYCKKHYELLYSLFPEKNIFSFGFPSKGQLLEPVARDKKYDFVNFAMAMSGKKGYHDSIKALALVKRHYPDVKLNLVGGCSDEVRAELMTLIEENGLNDNVVFTPFFAKQSDMFLHIQKSRFALLPCKMDNVSGTMTQSMQLGLPLIVYRTTGTPGFNKEKECALIAEHSNIEDLASKMLMLMNSPELAEKLKANAREFQENRARKAMENGGRLIANIKAIIDNHKNGTPIPQDMLFNPERDE